MASNLNEFLSTFTTDVSRPNKFYVVVNVPPFLLSQYSNMPRALSFRCETAEIPGRTINTIDQKFGSNPIEKFPNQSSYNDLTLTFIVSDDMSEKAFFDAWMDFINPTSNFNFKYKVDYAVPIYINQYDVTDQLSFQVECIDAYPIAINQLDLDWSSDGHHKLTVVFAYTYYNTYPQQAGVSLPTDTTLGISSQLQGAPFPPPPPPNGVNFGL